MRCAFCAFCVRRRLHGVSVVECARNVRFAGTYRRGRVRSARLFVVRMTRTRNNDVARGREMYTVHTIPSFPSRRSRDANGFVSRTIGDVVLPRGEGTALYDIVSSLSLARRKRFRFADTRRRRAVTGGTAFFLSRRFLDENGFVSPSRPRRGRVGALTSWRRVRAVFRFSRPRRFKVELTLTSFV